jgi:hypothetical protein
MCTAEGALWSPRGPAPGAMSAATTVSPHAFTPDAESRCTAE